MPPTNKRYVVWIGRTLEVVASIALLGWLQERDPDCVYTTEVFMQIRLCAPEIAGEPQEMLLGRLAIILGLFLVGVLCVWVGAKRK